jgi:kumamolisin
MAKSMRLAEHPRSVLPGSEKAPVVSVSTDAAPAAKPASSSAKVTVSVIVRRKQPLKVNSLGKDRVTRAEFNKLHSADPDAIKLVKQFAREFNLQIVADPKQSMRRTVQLTGTSADMQTAFGVKLMQTVINGQKYRVREGSITLPKGLIGAVIAVLGLDNRPQAEPHFRVRRAIAATPAAEGASGVHSRATADVSYTPVQVGQAYGLAANASGAGQTIGIIELGGGYRAKDITAYFRSIGKTAPSVFTVSVDGGKNAPSTANSADGEVMLDIEVAAAIAPGAKIVVYFTPNTDQGFINAITTAVHDTTNKPSVISISWGGPESTWTAQSMLALDAACQSAAALGVTITVASGDNGSTDGVSDGANHVDFPASSPHVLACGGTKLAATGPTISSEVAWNELASGEGATGGGISNVFALPSWQSKAGVPAPTMSGGGRGVPDVSGDADPNTGYVIRVDGQSSVIGGTSAVAPLWAGLIAVANQMSGKTAGFINPAIYAAKAAGSFNDITEGNNGAYKAGSGWDACTGLGSPKVASLMKLLDGSSTTVTPTKPPTKKPTKPKAPKKPAPKKARALR